MDATKAFRVLRHRRRLVLAALIVACLVGIAIPYRIGFPPKLTARQHDVGVASASALVDSAKSQVADLGLASGANVGSLSYRASLLASIMTSSPIVNDISQRAGIPAGTLIVTGPATIVGTGSPAPAVSASTISASNPRATTLTATVPTLAAGQIPVIQVSTQARTSTIAANVANAAFAALEADVSAIATTDKIPALQRLVVRPLGAANAGKASQGAGLMFGLVGAVLAFALLCGAIVGYATLSSAWRDASAAEDEAHAPAGARAQVEDEDEDEAWLPKSPPREAPSLELVAPRPLVAERDASVARGAPKNEVGSVEAEDRVERDSRRKRNGRQKPEDAPSESEEAPRARVTEAALALDKLLQSI
jgi:hypothetical protein